MIDPKRWATFAPCSSDMPEFLELYDALDERFTCPRCGREDLPLALFPAHNKSCAFECALGMPAVELIDSLKDRIEELESAGRDALGVIHWFEGWLNNRGTPLQYDVTPCNRCGHPWEEHHSVDLDCRGKIGETAQCPCDEYTRTHYSVSYSGRDVSRMKNSIARGLGQRGLGYLAERYVHLFTDDRRCASCHGTFDMMRMVGRLCEWCNRHTW